MNYLFTALVAWHIPCEQELFVFGEIGFDFRFISCRPLPRRAMMDQMVTSFKKQSKKKNISHMTLLF